MRVCAHIRDKNKGHEEQSRAGAVLYDKRLIRLHVRGYNTITDLRAVNGRILIVEL